MLKVLIGIVITVLLTGCADHVSFDAAKTIDPVGFWYGLWHGLIIVVALVVSLFSDETAIYAIYNNGGWYNFGFVLGVGGFSLGSGVFAWGVPDDEKRL